ncbi:transposase, partial [Mesorhizobium sp. M0145]|uniref:hypothetical protein n=1 Tax=Mesorhizobium sp. M0145 TaxID=2956895 RepID=UPI00333DCA9C
VNWVEDNIEETLSFYRLPLAHHKHMKSTDDIDKPDFGFSIPVAFLCSAQVSLFLRPGPQDFPCERVETQSRLAGAMAARPAARFPGHALTASSTAPVWSGPRRRSCRHVRYAIFVRHGRPRGKEWCERMRVPPRSRYSRSSFVASVRRFGPRGRQCRTISSYARSAFSAAAFSLFRNSFTL